MMGRVLYGALFTVALPLLLVFWAQRLDGVIALPVVHSTLVGWGLAVLTLVMLVEAMRELFVIGGGLPMNAYPPPRYVTRGLYGWIAHPIYIAFVGLVAGVSIATGSAAGFWIVTPFTALACLALVHGFEAHDLSRRFGADRARPLLSLPPNAGSAREAGDVLSLWLIVLLPWLVFYEAIGHLPVPGARPVGFEFEAQWPVIVWTEAIYALVYPFVVFAPLALRTRKDARQFCIRGWVGTGLGMLAYLVIPWTSPPRPFQADGLLASLLALERADGLAGRAAFPSFHVYWAWWAAAAWGIGSVARRSLATLVVLAIMVSCVTTGMHAMADVVAGTALALAVFKGGVIWNALRQFAERLANSWREWQCGPLRLLVHGYYAGLASIVGAFVAGALLGEGGPAQVAFVSAASLVGAGLWGQYWVGSTTLLRPFGYFGSVLGVTLVLGAQIPFGIDVWPLAAAVSVAAPWAQGVGRLRCLVQGCCHGMPAPSGVGIVITAKRSRVINVSALGDVPIHPTPLYSLLANTVIGLLLARLWLIGASPTVIVGAYLILTGLARFVEESYRGERQTPVVWRLRLYQWFAAASVALGIGVSCVAPDARVPVQAHVDLVTVCVALAVGVVHVLAMGVDFPNANRRFSRLV